MKVIVPACPFGVALVSMNTMILTLDSCRINLDTRTVTREDRQLRLTGIEAELLRFMVGRPQTVLPREELYREVWKHQAELKTRTLDLAILRLRKKIERDPTDPTHIITVYGVGYTFVPQGETVEPAPPREPSVSATNLSRPENDFFGRSEECVALDDWVDKGQGCLTILGPPGTGKTRLVQQWASARLAQNRFTTVWFCDLTGTRTEREAIHCIATTLSVSISEGEGASLLEQLGRAIAAKGETLILLDNAEQVVEPLAPVVKGLWEHAPEARLVVTSQIPLGLQLEQRLQLAPLPTPDATESPEDSPAMQLFVDRARRVKSSFSLTSENRDEVAAIVTELDGLPLAIELAASRAHVMTPAVLRAKLSDRFRLLRRPKAAGHARHETLQAALDWSWSLLQPWEQSALAQCGVFEGGFDWEAVEGVVDLSEFPEADWSVDVVAGLVDRSLIRAEDHVSGGTRLSLLMSVAAYAKARLDESGDAVRRAAHQRHADHYVQWSARYPAERSITEAETRRAVQGVYENLVAALGRSIQHGWVAQTYSLLSIVGRYLEWRGAYHVALDYLNASLVLNFPPEQRVKVVHMKGYLLLSVGQMDEALISLKEALEICESIDAPMQRIRGLNAIAIVYENTGRAEEAFATYEMILADANLSVHPDWEGMTRDNLGRLCTASGQIDRGLDELTRAHAILTRLRMPRQILSTLRHLGEVHLLRGELALSLDYLQQAQSIASELQLSGIGGACLAGMAKVHAHKGDFSKAYSCLDQAEGLLGERDGVFVELVLLLSRIEVDIEARAWPDVEINLNRAEVLGRSMGSNTQAPARRKVARLRARFEERSR